MTCFSPAFLEGISSRQGIGIYMAICFLKMSGMYTSTRMKRNESEGFFLTNGSAEIKQAMTFKVEGPDSGAIKVNDKIEPGCKKLKFSPRRRDHFLLAKGNNLNPGCVRSQCTDGWP